ncbi:MAG: nitroreductase family protein [Pseudomonadota bacterium]
MNKIYDIWIFYRYSFFKDLSSRENYEAWLTKQYHIVEKGLAMPSPKKNFGAEKIRLLVKVSEQYMVEYGQTDLLQTVSSTLLSYLSANEELAADNPDLHCLIERFITSVSVNEKGGTKLVAPAVFPGFEGFVKARSSIRSFNAIEVDNDLVTKAVDIAKYSPSVCNRQGWKVHMYAEKNKISGLLSLQDGNGGFGQTINKLLIVTADSRCFTNLESNQLFVDGGLFSMTLLLSLHSMGVGSCCLNLCVPYTREQQIKSLGEIGEFERPIMMIGIGNYDSKTRVAISCRKDSDQILQLH